MSLVAAQIPVSWISNYPGPHRVCYRVVGAPSYICTVPGTPGPGYHPNCAGGGAPCSYNIEIMVDNETCDQVDYEGYVQAACEDEASLIGRIPFAVSFIPAPACKRFEVTCDNSPVEDVTINDGGTGYSDGVYNGLPATGGGGAGATFDVTVAGGVITVVAVATPGSGYTSAPTVDISTIPYAPGTPADLVVNLTGCPDIAVYGCTGLTGVIIPASTFQPGESTFMCNVNAVPTEFSFAEVGNCLCNCIEQDVQNTFDGGSIDYSYIDCNGTVQSGTLIDIQTTGPVCMVDGSLETVVNAPAVLNIDVVGACNAVP